MNDMLLAWNPNISDEELRELLDEHKQARERLVDSVMKGAEKIKDPRQLREYLAACMPVLARF